MARLRIPTRRDQDLPPRPHYNNAIARHYADLGYVEFAELVEAGHGCAACHLTHRTNGIPTDDELDLERYEAVSLVGRFARALAEVGADGIIGASWQIEAALAKHSIQKIVLVSATEEADPLVARALAHEIVSNPVAYRSYQQLQKQGTIVELHFGPAPARTMGEAHPPYNVVQIYVRNHANVKELASTLVHESSHIHRAARGNVTSLLDEVRARSREVLYRTGRRPTGAERRAIWRQVEGMAEYDGLPVR